ncbi:MAG: hypothetical protein WD378_06570 [Egicoccus sp.]
MRRVTTPWTPPRRPQAAELLRRRLDEAADAVARDLDRGALASAWARTRSLEREVDPTAACTPAEPMPPAPVIGRRFAAAHRRMLFDPPVADHAGAAVRTHPAA